MPLLVRLFFHKLKRHTRKHRLPKAQELTLQCCAAYVLHALLPRASPALLALPLLPLLQETMIEAAGSR